MVIVLVELFTEVTVIPDPRVPVPEVWDTEDPTIINDESETTISVEFPGETKFKTAAPDVTGFALNVI